MKKLYSFDLDWGRMGSLDGLFIADEKEVADIIGKTVDFGEALGKHSQVEDEMAEGMFEAIELPESVLKVLEKKIGTTLSGYNPLEILAEEEEWHKRFPDTETNEEDEDE